MLFSFSSVLMFLAVGLVGLVMAILLSRLLAAQGERVRGQTHSL